MNILILLGLVITLGLVGPSAGDEVEDVLDCAPKVVLDAVSLDRDFQLLDSMLAERVKDSKDFGSLMKAAKELGSQKTLLEDASAGDKSKNVRRIKKAINKFVKLEKALDKCDFSGYYTLASNYKAALNSPLLQAGTREAIKRHSKNCRRTYLRQFEQKMRKVNRNLVDKIDKLLDQQVLERIFVATTNDKETTNIKSMDVVLKNNLWAPIRKIDDLLLMNIVKLAKGTKQAKYFKKPVGDEAEMGAEQTASGVRFRNKVYQRQLIKPCKRFVKEFAEIFYAAKLDLAATELDSKTKLAEINPKNEQKFTDFWVKFRVCQAIKEDSRGVLKRISAEAEKKLGLSQ